MPSYLQSHNFAVYLPSLQTKSPRNANDLVLKSTDILYKITALLIQHFLSRSLWGRIHREET